MKNIKQLIILSAACMFTPAAMHAQKKDSTLVRTVVVENEYNPDIMNASKINIVPTIEEPQAVKKNIEYAITPRSSGAFGFQPMSSFGVDPLKADAYRGYARAGFGNLGNIDAKVHYLFNLGEKDRLDASASFSGMNGKLDKPDSYYSDKKWKSRYYTSRLQAAWEHDFANLMLGINGKAESQVFSYLDDVYKYDTGKQHNSFGELHVNLIGTDKEAPIRFSAGTGFMYAKQKYSDTGESYNEGRLHTTALFAGDLGENSEISIGANMDNFFYSAEFYSGEMKDYTSVELNPAVQFKGDGWKLRAGAHVDLQTANGSGFQVAPDVIGEYSFAKGYALYAQATGGRQINDFRHLNKMYPYFPYFSDNNNPTQYKNTYTQIDARAGFKAAFTNELHLHFFGGYRSLKDELSNVIEDWIGGAPTQKVIQGKANEVFAGATLQYAYKDYLSTNLSGTWHNWDSDDELSLWMHPEFEFNWTMDFKVMKNLQVNLGYEYVQRSKENSWEERVKAINNLSAGLTYSLTPALGIWAKGDNLLDKDYFYYAGYPNKGINFMAGACLKF